MKTELRMRPHTVLPGEAVIELWWHGQLIGQVTSADGPGVRVISKHPMQVGQIGVGSIEIRAVIEIRIDPVVETT